MLRKYNLLALALGFALSMNSCHLLHNMDDEDPKPQTQGWVKGSLRYQPSFQPTVVCETPCDWTQPLQTTLYFTKKQPYYLNGPIPEIVDSTKSNEQGEFEKQLPAGSYSLLVTHGKHKYRSPMWVQTWESPPYAFSFEIHAGQVTNIRPVLYFEKCATIMQ